MVLKGTKPTPLTFQPTDPIGLKSAQSMVNDIHNIDVPPKNCLNYMKKVFVDFELKIKSIQKFWATVCKNY